MTISSTEELFSGPYAGDGVTSVFDYDFKIYDAGELIVERTVSGVTTVLAEGTDYTVAGVGLAGGGSITLLDPATDAPTGATLVILPNIEFSQTRPFGAQSSTSLNELELAFDKITSLSRQLLESTSRSIQLPPGDGSSPRLPEPSEGRTLLWGVDGLENGPTPAELGDANTARDEAIAAAALAEDWAESATAPGDPGTKSSKTWAGAAEVSAGEAEDSAAAAAASAAEAALYDGPKFDTVAAMLADDRAVADGDYLSAGGVRYVAVSSGAHVTNAGGQGYKIASPLDYYTPSMFGALPGTMTDYRDELEACAAAAFADKKIMLLDGLYRSASPFRIPHRGLRVRGIDRYQCGVYPVASTTEDTVQVTGSGVQIENMSLNAWGGGMALAVRGASRVTIEGNVFLDRSGGTGTAILLDDRNPAGTFVAGAYAHRIVDNDMYQGGYYFSQCVKTQGTSGGMNNCEIVRNQMAADGDVIYIHGGGGNRIRGNYIKSGTGLPGAGLRVGKGVNSLNGLQFIEGNYFENLQYALFDRSETRWIGSNHLDNCDNYWGLSSGSRNPPFAVGDKGVQSVAIESLEGDTGQFYNLTGDDAVLPVRARLRVSGNGAIRTGCTLSTTGARDGMLMWVEGTSWPFELVENSAVDFGSEAGSSLWFGTPGTALTGSGASRPGYVGALFMYSNAKWRLQYASRAAPAVGNVRTFTHGGAGAETVTVGNSSLIRLNTGGAAHRDGNSLSAPLCDNQRLILMGTSGWRFQILNSATVVCVGGANINFGTAATQIRLAELVGYGGVWYEVSRAAV